MEGAAEIGNFKFKLEFLGYEPKDGGYTPATEPVTEDRPEPSAEVYNQTKSNNGGMVTFAPLTFAYEGTYRFKVTETAGTGTYLYDHAVYTADVVVEKNPGSGNLTVTSTEIKKGDASADEIVFNNVKTTGLTLTKNTTKPVTSDTTFSFTVTAKKDDALLTLENLTVTGGTVSLDNAKTKAVVEVKVPAGISAGSVTINGIPVGAEITITEGTKAGWVVIDPEAGDSTDKKISIALKEELSENAASFTNEYRPTGEWTPSGTKALTGRTLTDGAFHFVVKEGNAVVSYGTNKADGEIVFDTITYNQAGEH